MRDGVRLPNPWVEPLLSIELAGRFLHVSRTVAFRAAADGSLPTIPVGRGRRVPTVALYRMTGLPIPPQPSGKPAPSIVTS